MTKVIIKDYIKRLLGINAYINKLVNLIDIICENHNNVTISYLQRKLVIQKMETLHLLNPIQGVALEKNNGEHLIVSLTTHSKRIFQVYLAIESIMQQTMKPNKIILWLDEKSFTFDSLPLTIIQQINRGLEVRFVKDILSYTKIIYSLKEFPNSTIITIDDDVIYAHDLIERLYKTHLQNPNCIICSFGRDLQSYVGDRRSLSYNSCVTTTGSTDQKSLSIVPEGFSGVLYPMHSLNEECFNEDVFLSIAPTCDDLWLKAMSLLNNTNVVEMGRYIINHSSYNTDITDCWDIGLRNENLSGSNDKQFHNIFRKYDLYESW